MYDFLVVGAGLSGATWARCAVEAGYRILVIDRRPHVGGNCYTENVEGILVHRYGAHIFHTANVDIWRFVCRFADFSGYHHRVKACVGDVLYSFPINLMTLQQLWGVRTPTEARRRLEEERLPLEFPQNLEEWCLAHIGRTLYEMFIEGYTTKQWGVAPQHLPAALIKRLPLRFDYNDSYFPSHHHWQGIPRGGYTALIQSMLDGTQVELGVDFLQERNLLERLARHVVYTGPLDMLFGHSHGVLGYRSLRFDQRILPESDHQGTAVVNWPEVDCPWTRIIEHKHFDPGDRPGTVVTYEYPLAYEPGAEPYYPLPDSANRTLADLYAGMARDRNYTLLGRLATYNYMDMDACIGQALSCASRVMNVRQKST